MNHATTMKRTALAVILFFTAPAFASAGNLQAEWKACHETCNAVAEECQFLNDVDACEASRRACSASCDESYPTLAICVDQCDGLLLFCRQDGFSSRSACREENQSCVSRCESAVVTQLN